MTDIAVTRRYIKKDYFESGSGFLNATPAPANTTQRHWETGRLTWLTEDEHAIVVTFKEPFPLGVIPVGMGFTQVYKFVQDTDGDWIKQDVLHKFPENVTPHTQLLITVDSSESMALVIIEYMLTE